MQEKARTLCLACHDSRIVIQQQLDRHGWAKVVDKMIRWGTPVAPEDREPLIEYFANGLGVRESNRGAAELPSGPGVEKVRAACLGCHDAGVLAEEKLDRRGWGRSVDKMVRWGAAVPREDREAILDYLAANFSASGRSPAKRPTKGSK